MKIPSRTPAHPADAEAPESPELDLLNHIAIEDALARLAPEDRELIHLLYAYECPLEYSGPWPVTREAVGQYIGMKYRGRPLSVSAVKKRHAIILARWSWKQGHSPECAAEEPMQPREVVRMAA